MRLLLLIACLVLASCGRGDIVPADATADRRDVEREQRLLAAAAATVEAAATDRLALLETDPARIAELRLRAESLRLRADHERAAAAVLLSLRDEARAEAVAQRQQIADQRQQERDQATARWAWIVAGIGLALSVAAGVLCLRVGVSLWYPSAAAAGFAVLGGVASAYAVMSWVLGAAVVAGLLALAVILGRKVWLAGRATYRHGDRVAARVRAAVAAAIADADIDAGDAHAIVGIIDREVAAAKDESRHEQQQAGIAGLVAAARPTEGA